MKRIIGSLFVVLLGLVSSRCASTAIGEPCSVTHEIKLPPLSNGWLDIKGPFPTCDRVSIERLRFRLDGSLLIAKVNVLNPNHNPDKLVNVSFNFPDKAKFSTKTMDLDNNDGSSETVKFPFSGMEDIITLTMTTQTF
jgi:hypothetical protein